MAALVGSLSHAHTCHQGLRNKHVCNRQVVVYARRLQYASIGQKLVHEPLIVPVRPDGSDSWRLDPVISILQKGGVGIVPTDTLPAIVCDMENRDAVSMLYKVKKLDPKKPLSILCRSMSDISHYTAGFPVSNQPGHPNWFNFIKNKRILPGPFTLILPASKNLPTQCVDFMNGKTIHRKQVGVRIPDDPVCQAVLEGMGKALLCTSVHVPELLDEDTEVPDMGSMLEAYGNSGIDFIVDVGRRVATRSTVVDMTSSSPVVVREGKGDGSIFEV